MKIENGPYGVQPTARLRNRGTFGCYGEAVRLEETWGQPRGRGEWSQTLRLRK